MRIKILMLGADPLSLMADGQMLKEKGFLVVTAYDPQNINEMTSEVKPNLVFFAPGEPDNTISHACNDFVNDTHFTNIPVILTLSDEEEYLVTSERTDDHKDDRATITSNIIDAIKVALQSNPADDKLIPKKQNSRKKTTTVKEAHLFA